MIKEYDFHCPHCDAQLNKGEDIIINTIRSNGDKGIIKLATSLGNYKYVHEPAVKFEPGEVVIFSCPNCHEDLASDQYENYAALKMKVGKDIEFDILFSRKAGIHKTYLITEDGIETYSGN